jgi:Tol biopolymer transport system component
LVMPMRDNNQARAKQDQGPELIFADQALGQLVPSASRLRTMARSTAVALVSVMLFLLAGCGSSETPGSGGGSQVVSRPCKRTPMISDSPAWSPDGHKIAFVRSPSRGRMFTRFRWSEIDVMNADGTHRHRLTPRRPRMIYEAPAWSPNGKRIAFDGATRSSYSEIYVIDVDGSHRHRLTHLTQTHLGGAWSYEDPAWSPNGKRIAFDSNGHCYSGFCPESQLYVVNADGRNLQPLNAESSEGIQPAWSPDGKRIAYVDKVSVELYLISAHGGKPHRIAEHVWTARQAWSPNGKKIAFVGGTGGREQIYVMNADGSHTHPLTRGSVADFLPAWSPDGTRIAFDSSRDYCGDDDQIYVMTANGSKRRALTHE